MVLLQLKNVHKSFGTLQVLKGVSLDFSAGETTVILGASGTGKSVLLKHIVGLLGPDQGEVWYLYRNEFININTLRSEKLANVRKDFGFCFQMGALFDSITAGENVAFPLVEHTQKTQDEIREIASQKLAMVGLEDVYEKYPSELSGGMRKRVALARAIALDPRMIFYDEPTTGLDPVTSDLINELILKLQKDLGVTSIVVTHDMTSAFKVADRIVMIHQGEVIASGTPIQIRLSTDERVRRFIEGKAEAEDLIALNRSRSMNLSRSWFFDDVHANLDVGTTQTSDPSVKSKIRSPRKHKG